MIPHNDIRIECAIATIADRYLKDTGKHISQTYLYKCLAFIDFESLDTWGYPVFELTYLAMQNGPVPKEIYREQKYQQSDYYLWESDNNGNTEIIPTLPYDFPEIFEKYFNKYERNLIKRIVSKNVGRHSTTTAISEHSHEKLIAWQRAKDKRPELEMHKYLHFMEGLSRQDTIPEDKREVFKEFLLHYY